MKFSATFLVQAEGEKRPFRGLGIVIENPKGSIRTGTDPEGNKWERPMRCDYGHIPGTEAAGDKENVDVYVGEDEAADEAYVVEQVGPDGEFDEYKLMLGFPDLQTAEEMYRAHGPTDWDGLGEIYGVPLNYLFDAVEKHQKTAAPSVIEQFMADYTKQLQSAYGEVANQVRDILTGLCGESGIRVAVTARAKSIDSLRSKLEKRNAVKPYPDTRAIILDVKDMAGVRVALYFPIDRENIGALLQENFEHARPVKHFPEDRDPGEDDGYEADHYAIMHGGLVVEVQVASALMYAYSEVAHDLIYKPRQGPLETEEYLLLNELKGLVSAGEERVKQLVDSLNARTASVSPRAARYLLTILAVRDRILMQK